MSEQLFSADELREMGRRTLDRLVDAVDAGDPDAAKQIAQRMYNEFLSMHDGYRNWITALLSEIGRRMGDEALDGVFVYAPDGVLIGRIALPERCANVCFGGLKRNRLFMAASQSMYSLYVNTQGVAGG